jgi:hypothetical protein
VGGTSAVGRVGGTSVVSGCTDADCGLALSVGGAGFAWTGTESALVVRVVRTSAGSRCVNEGEEGGEDLAGASVAPPLTALSLGELVSPARGFLTTGRDLGRSKYLSVHEYEYNVTNVP